MSRRLARVVYAATAASLAITMTGSAGISEASAAPAAPQSMGPTGYNGGWSGYSVGGRWFRFVSVTLTVPTRTLPAANSGDAIIQLQRAHQNGIPSAAFIVAPGGGPGSVAVASHPGAPTGARPRVPCRTGIYTPEWTERAYRELLHRATALLARGESVIADASFTSARQRIAATTAAAAVSADLIQLRCTASRELAARRLCMPARGASDADQAIAAQMEAAADPWPDATVIDTEDSGTAGLHIESVQQALQAIRRHGLGYVWHPSRPYMCPG